MAEPLLPDEILKLPKSPPLLLPHEILGAGSDEEDESECPVLVSDSDDEGPAAKRAKGNNAADPPLPSMLHHSCCKHKCVDNENVRKYQAKWQDRSEDERKTAIYNQIVDYVTTEAGEPGSANLDGSRMPLYPYFSQVVCRSAFQSLWNISNRQVARLRKHALEGYGVLPLDMRTTRTVRPTTTKTHVANQFWLWAYYHLAENVAEDVELQCEPESTTGAFNRAIASGEKESSETLKDSESGPSTAKVVLQPECVPRRLQPLYREEIYRIFDNWVHEEGSNVCSTTIPSHDTVKRVYQYSWSKKLPFRRHSDHVMCDVCMDLQVRMKKCTPGTPAAKEIHQEFISHQRDQMRDRDVCEAI